MMITMFLTKREAEELRALVPGDRVDLITAIERVTEPLKSRTSTFDLEVPTVPIPPETMRALQESGRHP